MDIYPRKYICDSCGYQQIFNKKQHRRIRVMFRLNEELILEKWDRPLFFECHMCHEGMMKPENYSGPEGYIIPTLEFGDDDDDFDEFDDF